MDNKLSYGGFKNVVLSQMKKRLENTYGIKEISEDKKVKNNDTLLESILVKFEDGRGAPMFYVHDLYKMYSEGAGLEEIIDGLCELYTRCSTVRFPLEERTRELLADFKKAKPLIRFKLINGVRNKRRMEGKPCSRVGEFLISYQLQIDDERGGIYALQITEEMLREWGIDADSLYDVAISNMDLSQNYWLSPIEEVLGIGSGAAAGGAELEQMFVLSNKAKINGAGVIFSKEVRQNVGKRLGGDYYLLPSSVHEWIVIPKNRTRKAEELEELVQSVNSNLTRKEEFLSDYVYEYDVAKEEIRRAATKAVLM